MSDHTWATTFRALFDRCVEKYRSGNIDFTTYYSEEDGAFLESIGYKPRELFDFVEDYCDESVPSPEDAVLIAAARRDYLNVFQKGEKSEAIFPNHNLPAKDSELAGELDPETMYSCGGDRAFLKSHDIHAADFLRAVWAAGDDDQKIIDYVNS